MAQCSCDETYGFDSGMVICRKCGATWPIDALEVPLNRYAYRTHSGVMVDLSNPECAEIRIEDIAHHLARICRYSGAVDDFYSVASHCVYVATELQRGGAPLYLVRAGLLHDAPEAYLGDMVSGLKRLFPDYRILEDRWAARIERATGVLFENHAATKAAVKDADLRARLAEARDLFVEYPYPRELLHGGEGIDAAGHVIMAFGQFVVGGNFVVGVVVFLVLIAIQYIVYAARVVPQAPDAAEWDYMAMARRLGLYP